MIMSESTCQSKNTTNATSSVPLIVEEAQRWQKPFLLAGDWNDTPDSQLLQALKQHFTLLSGDLPTYPADAPEDCIDYVAIYKSQPAEMLEYHVLEEPEASDHRPLVVKIKLIIEE